jgi:phosphatidylglycerol:prolipoprotein diacylglycerol transferase
MLMLQYPDIDPVAVQLGPLAIHWYGVTYLFAFMAGWWLAKRRASRPGSGWNPDEIGDAVFYIVLGVIAGGKLGSLLFYQTDMLMSDPLGVLIPYNFDSDTWTGWAGMSFHGGFVGVLVAFWMYARSTQRTFFQVADFFAPAFPIGLGAGRIGNFINGELYGRITDVPWGMVFPHAGPEPRHPNQLYQFFCEGVLLFLIVWWFSSKPRPRMAVSGLFVLCYGIYRFLIEFVRQPDSHLGFIAFDWLTMGQLLSLPMILLGITMLLIAYRNQGKADAKLS